MFLCVEGDGTANWREGSHAFLCLSVSLLCLQEPYRLIYFVLTDQMRTTIAVLRAVLKEG